MSTLSSNSSNAVTSQDIMTYTIISASTSQTMTSTMTHETTTRYTMTADDIIFITTTTLASLLSVFGTSVIIGVHIVFKSLRTTGRSMLVQLSIADLQLALGNLMGVLWYLFRDTAVIDRSMAYCSIQSSWTIFSSIASFLWVVAIGISLCLAIIGNMPTIVDRYWIVFMIVCWGIPTIVTIAVLSSNVLGYDPDLHSPSWCWISPEADNMFFWQFFTGKAWELSAYCLTIILYSAVKIALIRHESKNVATKGRQSRRDVIQEANVKLTFVPLVFIASRSWGTIRFLLGVFAHDYASSPDASWIAPLQGMGDSSEGFFNFIIYCFFTSSIRRRLLSCCYSSDGEATTSGHDLERSSRPGGTSSVKVEPAPDK